MIHLQKNLEDKGTKIMIEKELTILNRSGLHTRPASQFVNTANQFKSEITIYKGDAMANGKSIISMIALGASKGSKIRLIVEGPDEKEAIEALRTLIENKFGED